MCGRVWQTFNPHNTGEPTTNACIICCSLIRWKANSYLSCNLYCPSHCSTISTICIKYISKALYVIEWCRIIDPILNHPENIETETKWPTFSRRQVQSHFLEWKCINFHYYFTEFCSKGSNQQYSNMGSDDGLAPARWQAIIRING